MTVRCPRTATVGWRRGAPVVPISGTPAITGASYLTRRMAVMIDPRDVAGAREHSPSMAVRYIHRYIHCCRM